MKLPVTLAWLGMAAVAFAAPKFAIVRVTDIYRKLPSTVAMQEDIQKQRNAIMENQRAEQLRAIIVELQALQTQLQEQKDEIDSEAGTKLVRSYEIKRQEAETLREEFEEFRAEEDKRINKEMVSAMRESLEKITTASEQLAKERNLDAVFDTSGNSNTGLPFVLYHGSAPDISDDVMELLGEKPLEESVTPSADSAAAEPKE
ncbi:OmpH family outer membrane protein [Luteolibacter algae]|uniref:OmpH family outer membrane protein n=1 Tax=Luteolibacter algae TaxID=454151 RepID=A0ABW5DAI8_9BACT